MRRERKIFMIDIDGVACDHAKAVCKWVNKRYKISSEVNDVTSWNHNFGPITFVQAVEMCYPCKDFILNMEVTPGFSEFLENIRRMFVTRFITLRKKYSHDATLDWIRGHFREFDVHFVKSKNDVDFDYLIDDSISEVVTLASVENSESKKYFLLKRPWNSSKLERGKIRQFGQIHFIETFGDVFSFLQ